ncbi:MAG: class I SAM-dependent methyltransferase [Casimicrobiaceae bacterium]
MTLHCAARGEIDAPSRWIARFAPLIVPGGTVLDVACGRGRHCRFLAARGHHVTGVDRDASSLASLATTAGVAIVTANLETAPWPFAGEHFDAVVVTRYLHRPLFPALLDALAPDGVLLYETFAAGNEAFGKPSNPDFLLAHGELLAVIGAQLTVVAFEQGVIIDERPQVVQRVAALGHARAWPPALPG